jgi:hypothetical protein
MVKMEMSLIDTSELKKLAQNMDEPARSMIISFPDEIDQKDLVSKMDLILRIIEKKEEWVV